MAEPIVGPGDETRSAVEEKKKNNMNSAEKFCNFIFNYKFRINCSGTFKQREFKTLHKRLFQRDKR